MQWFFDIVTEQMLNAGFINDWARAKIWQNAPQIVPNVTWTKVPFHVTSFENRITVDLLNYQLIIQDAGYYVVTSSTGLDAMGIDKRIHTSIRLNGDTLTYAVFANVALNEDIRYPTATVEYLEVGDILSLWVWHNHGAGRNTLAQEFSTNLAAHRLS